MARQVYRVHSERRGGGSARARQGRDLGDKLSKALNAVALLQQHHAGRALRLASSAKLLLRKMPGEVYMSAGVGGVQLQVPQTSFDGTKT